MKSLRGVRILSLSLILLSLGQKSFAQGDSFHPSAIENSGDLECTLDQSTLETYKSQSQKFIAIFNERYWALEKIAKAQQLVRFVEVPFVVYAASSQIYWLIGISELAAPVMYAAYGITVPSFSAITYCAELEVANLDSFEITRQKLIGDEILDFQAGSNKYERKDSICKINKALTEVKESTGQYLEEHETLLNDVIDQQQLQVNMQVKLTSYAIQYRAHQVRLKHINSLLNE